MPANTLILYPNEPDITFDINYCLNLHMPLVERLWTKYGLRNWQVTKFTCTPDGSKSPYLICTTIEWESIDGVRAAFAGPEFVDLIKDAANMSNKRPIFLIGEQLGAD
ncbi:hypothetical protein BDV28DRAFT_144845 [Aspergillus coremiiformis]|uniref:EthD domain-containing protein n=1 Tax=Aspergillus coremiiformis TaxID=138285 RepID=A0A5N6ZGH6_9EURO|nr:hypothetical protein BDV28DRAFT_144845 [Aspergillus coremiiformis]